MNWEHAAYLVSEWKWGFVMTGSGRQRSVGQCFQLTLGIEQFISKILWRVSRGAVWLGQQRLKHILVHFDKSMLDFPRQSI